MYEPLDKKLLSFFSKYPLIQYKKKEILLRAEDSPQGAYYLLNGYIRTYTITPDGVELTLNIFKPGTIFPLSWCVAGIENNYFYEAMTASHLYRAPKEEALLFMKDDKT